MQRSCSIIKRTAAILICCAACAILSAQEKAPTATSSPQAPAPTSMPSPTDSSTAAQPQASPQETSKKAAPEFLVLIDPSHGGDDKGVTYSNRTAEKDITLAFARELRNELDERGIAVRLLRESDINLPMEKRAEIANGHHNAIYIAIHAGFTGQGVHVYSSMLPAAAGNAGPFIPWSVAQAGSLPRSRILSKAVVGELTRKRLRAVALDAPLRPLNNIAAPAIAVELAPKGGDSRSVENQKMQNLIASAIAAGIASSRGQMGLHP